MNICKGIFFLNLCFSNLYLILKMIVNIYRDLQFELLCKINGLLNRTRIINDIY